MGVKLRSYPLKNGQKQYYLDIHEGYPAKRRRESLKIPRHLSEKERREMAEAIRGDRQMKIFKGETGIAKRRRFNFVDYFEDFVKTEKSINDRKYKNTVRHFKLCFGPTILSNQLNNKIFEKWKTYLEDNFNGETPNTMWRATRTVINKAIKDGDLPRNPAPDVKAPERVTETIKEVLYPEELEVLFNTAWENELVCRGFLFCCFTGLTYPELKSLRWNQISREARNLKYYRSKTKKPVVVDLSDSALNLLPEETGPKVFPLFPSDSYCSRILKRWVKSSGIRKDISWYCGRHTFAILLLKGGADLASVSKLMGHRNLNTTMKYLNYLDDEKRKAVDGLPNLKFPKATH